MRQIFLLLFLLLMSKTFALPCPNGGGILYRGDSIEEVIKECGEPTSRRNTSQIMSSSQQSLYYIPHQYDTGYSELAIYYNNDRVSNMRVFDHFPLYLCQNIAVQVGQMTTIQTSCGDTAYNTAYTTLCGWAIGIGDSLQRVEFICGPPSSKSLQNNTIETTELTYSGGTRPQTIIFQNGRLLDWR